MKLMRVADFKLTASSVFASHFSMLCGLHRITVYSIFILQQILLCLNNSFVIVKVLWKKKLENRLNR